MKTRYEQPEIARQLLSNEVDVILGGGARCFGEKKQKGPDLIPQFKEKGWGHTANMIPIFAYGPGAESFDGVLDNTQISKMTCDLIPDDELYPGVCRIR